MTENSYKKKVIAIVGPTAAGKTSYAIQLAKKNNGEVISADSRLVYKGFDIATAKPTQLEQDGVRHHLIDIVEPEVDYSVANFCDDAKIVIDDIVARRKTPIICGGTGLYFRILLENYELPRFEPDYDLRSNLEKFSCEELYEKIKLKAPEKLEKIHINNKVRLIRTLEILEHGAMPSVKDESDYDVEWIGVTKPREELYERINMRVDLMLEAGLVEETKNLLDKHGRIRNLVGTIGYREIISYLDGEMSFDEAISKLKQNTRNYAKRQLTWFRRNKALNF